MRQVLGLATGSLLVSLLALGACVGDDPTADSTSSSSSGGSSGASSGNASSSGASSSSGTPSCAGDTVDACGDTCTKCTAPTGGTVACTGRKCVPSCGAQTVCGDACVDVQTSATNCGKCGHSCGAGSCVAGACQAVTVATFTSVKGIAASPKGIVIAADSEVDLCAKPEGCTAATSLTPIKSGVSQLNSVTVATTGTTSTVFWDGNEGDYEVVYSCPLDGCPAGIAKPVDNVVNDSVGRVIAGPNTVLWTRYQSYYGPYASKCTPPSCPSVDVVRPKAGTGPYYNDTTREQVTPARIFSVGATKTIWATGGLYNDNNKQLRYCTYGTSCATPAEISRGQFYGVSALTYFDAKHYVAMGNSTSPTGEIIGSISDASPSTPSPLVGDAMGISAIAVDASGIYWVNGATGRVAKCGTLTGCTGSGETLATGETGAKDIAVDDKYVYWATDTAVRKVAK